MKLKKFITSTVVCALAVISLSGMSVSAAEAPTNEKSFTPLAPAGWNTSTTAQQIYGDAEQEPMLSSTSRAPDGWNDSAAAKLLYGDAQEELITVYSSIIVTVHSPCDQEWRELYPDTWMFEANRAIEEADALMYDKFSIDLRSEKQTAWTGNTYSGNGDTLLDEAWAEEGLNGCNLMIAFTGKNFPYGGWGYVGGAGCLVIDQGYTFIGRYLNHSAGVRNGLTVSEANRLSNAGVFICALYESDSGTSISHFTRSNGIADAREAISLAEDLGMPTGNPIYFCIDTDVTKSQMTTYIVPYVQGILSELEGSGYKLGIYGPKPVCKYIRGTYSATERYMMICDNDWGQSGWSATERDFDDWNIRQYEWNQSLPGVSSVTIDKCESSTNGGGGWKL